MGGSARSPDMNPIEHVWDQMGVRIQDMNGLLSNVPEWVCAVLRAWAAVH